MKKLRSAAAASMVALSAFSAHALTFNLGTVGAAPGAPLGHSSIFGPFTDTYTFSLDFGASIDATPLSLSSITTPLGPIFRSG